MSAATVLEVRRAGLKAIFLTNRGFPWQPLAPKPNFPW